MTEPQLERGHRAATIPVLVADGKMIDGEQAILAYLNEPLHRAAGRRRAARQGGQGKAKGTGGSMSAIDSSYTLSTTTPLGFADAVARVREELAAEGFGVLCEIDVQATLKKKLGIDREPYLILGACNPSLAHAALEAEPELGRAAAVQRRRLPAARDRRTSRRSTPSRCSRSSATTNSPRPRARSAGACPRSWTVPRKAESSDRRQPASRHPSSGVNRCSLPATHRSPRNVPPRG